jgi:hypothetical protein
MSVATYDSFFLVVDVAGFLAAVFRPVVFRAVDFLVAVVFFAVVPWAGVL